MRAINSEYATRRRQRPHGTVQHAEQPVALRAGGAVQLAAFGAFVVELGLRYYSENYFKWYRSSRRLLMSA